MKDLLSKEIIKKLLKSVDYELVDQDQVYIPISQDFEIDLCVSYSAYADADGHGYYDHDTYVMEITDITIDKGAKWIRLEFTKEQLKKLNFSEEIEDDIKELYLKD